MASPSRRRCRPHVAVAIDQQGADAGGPGAVDVLLRACRRREAPPPARTRRARAPAAKIAGSGLRAPRRPRSPRRRAARRARSAPAPRAASSPSSRRDQAQTARAQLRPAPERRRGRRRSGSPPPSSRRGTSTRARARPGRRSARAGPRARRRPAPRGRARGSRPSRRAAPPRGARRARSSGARRAGRPRAARARPGCRGRRETRRGWRGRVMRAFSRRNPTACSLAAGNQSFWQEHGDEISAAITLVVAIVIAFLVDRLLIGAGGQVAGRVTRGSSRARRGPGCA